MSIVVVGAYMRDLYMFGPRLPEPGETVTYPQYEESHGGKAANQAVATARLGAETRLIMRLGTDEAGEAAYKLFQDEGIHVEHVFVDRQSRTGMSFIIVDQFGTQIIANYSDANAQLNLEDIEQARPSLQSASALLLQGEINARVSMAAAKMAGKDTRVILDPSPIETFAEVNFYEDVDILTPNQQEAAVIMGKPDPEAASIAKLLGISTVIIKKGEDGAEVYHDRQTYHVPTPRVKAVDTTGAGDCFNGALAVALDHGLDMLRAAKYACACASICVTRKFCIPSFPTSNEVDWNHLS